ncbi:MAG: Hsp20/alpha crystallin family protein [Nitrososphaerota archaeon]|nr:Hsp20/alpha crystallin family protein [Nitrososphaerota archaeon]
MSDDKKEIFYYGGKEKSADELQSADDDIAPSTARDIHRDFNRMLNQFQRDFEDFWGISSRVGRDVSSKARASIAPFTGLGVPFVDLEDQGKNYRLTAELPGFKKEDIQIDLTEDSVMINAKKTHVEDQKNKTYVRHERSAQTFCRKIHLPEPIRSDDASANLSQGILEISLPKKIPKETKKLTID